MKAVNLIPAESRSGGRTGIAPYALLGGLGVSVAAVAALVLAGNSVRGQEAELASVTAQTQAAQAQAAALAPYREFAALEESRVSTVKQLASSRFDWEKTLGELSRVLPDDAWLTSVTGTITTGVPLGSGGGGDASALRGAMANPAIEIVGCTRTQDKVARLLTRMKLMDGVVRVSLASSEKSDNATASAAQPSGATQASGGGDDCRNGSRQFPKFSFVVFFEQPGSAAPAAAAPPATAPASATTPAPTNGGSK